jgi:hypothetical protein
VPAGIDADPVLVPAGRHRALTDGEAWRRRRADERRSGDDDEADDDEGDGAPEPEPPRADPDELQGLLRRGR